MVREYLGPSRYSGATWALLGVVLVALVIATVLLVRSDPHRELLFVSTDNPSLLGGPVSVIDLKSGQASNLLFNASGCDGVAYDKKSRQIRISCRVGTEKHATYDPRDGVTSTSPPFSTLPMSFRSPLYCAENGRCYYGFGFVGWGGDDAGKIVVTEAGKVKKTVFTPSRDIGKFPVRFEAFGNTLYVLERGHAGAESVVRTFDMLSDEFVGQSIVLPAEALDIATNGSVLAVSTFMHPTTTKVLLYDIKTDAMLPGLPGDGPLAPSVFGIAINGNMLYTAGDGGVRAYALDTNTEVARYATADFAVNVTVSHDRVFVTVPNASQIIELSPMLEPMRVISKPVGFGDVFVVRVP